MGSVAFWSAFLRPFAALLIFVIAAMVNMVFRRYMPDGAIKRLLLRKIA